MGENLHDVISPGRPTEIQNSSASNRMVDFFSIHRNYTLSRGNRPNNSYIVLFSTTIGSCLAFLQGRLVGKAETPMCMQDMSKLE